jgi:hypothetical protein
MYKNFYGKLSTKRNIKKLEQKLEQNKKKQDRAYFHLEHLENLQSLHKDQTPDKEYIKMIKHAQNKLEQQNKKIHTTQMCLCKMREKHIINPISISISISNFNDLEPTFEESSLEEPTLEEPTFEESSLEEPTLEEPTFEEPTLEEPTFEEPTFEELCLKHYIKENTFQLNKEKEKLSELIGYCDNITSLLKEGNEPFLKKTYDEVLKLVIKQNKKVNKIQTRLNDYHQKLDAY